MASDRLHPATVLYREVEPFPILPVCEHFAGSEALIGKALTLQQTLGPIFDITCDCEDGAPAGAESAHAKMVAAAIDSEPNRFDRVGARVHDIRHPHWRKDLEILVTRAGKRLAYVTFPKCGGLDDAKAQLGTLRELCRENGLPREIPAHFLIETHGALREVEAIAALPGIETLDFGLMDFVSAHHGAIPAQAMKSPAQFEHPLVARAKCAVAAAALGHSRVPSHNVTTDLKNSETVRDDARRAREQFGYLRMWSIHPNQVQPIIEAMKPNFDEVNEAVGILLSAQQAGWGPIRHNDRLHDRASYRYYWELLARARTTGMNLPGGIEQQFFSAT